jgi:hypothetical protein
LSRAWTRNGEEIGYEVILREKARVWSIMFPAAPESTSSVETAPEEQSASVIDTKKGLAEKDEVLTPAPGGGRSHDCPSAPLDPE